MVSIVFADHCITQSADRQQYITCIAAIHIPLASGHSFKRSIGHNDGNEHYHIRLVYVDTVDCIEGREEL